ncbi:MAG: hypothetical protein V1936_02235 [Patescibacteria group bacterium]
MLEPEPKITIRPEPPLTAKEVASSHGGAGIYLRLLYSDGHAKMEGALQSSFFIDAHSLVANDPEITAVEFYNGCPFYLFARLIRKEVLAATVAN